MDQDELMSKEYAAKLATVTASNPVTSATDIYNKDGAILVGANKALTPEQLERLKQHRLAAPLEYSVQLQNSMAREVLYKRVRLQLAKLPYLDMLHRFLDANDDLRDVCTYYSQYPILVQLLTVYAELYPAHFNRAIMLAWGSWFVSRASGESQLNRRVLFTTCLFHEIGLLFVTDQQVERYTKEHQERLVLISAQALKKIPNLPTSIVKAVTGINRYPISTGFMSTIALDDVDNIDQIIWLSRFLYEVMNDRFSFKVGPADVLPLLKLYSTHYFRRYFNVVIKFVTDAHLPHRLADEHKMVRTVRSLLMNHVILTEWVERYEQLGAQLQGIPHVELPLRLEQKMEQISYILRSTGLLSDSLARWMSHVEEFQVDEAAPEVREYFVLQQELARQLSNFSEQALRFISGLKSRLNKEVLLKKHAELARMERQLNFQVEKEEEQTAKSTVSNPKTKAALKARGVQLKSGSKANQ